MTITIEVIDDKTFRFSGDGGQTWETHGITGGLQECGGLLIRRRHAEPQGAPTDAQHMGAIFARDWNK
jgi:hypothetical protein